MIANVRRTAVLLVVLISVMSWHSARAVDEATDGATADAEPADDVAERIADRSDRAADGQSAGKADGKDFDPAARKAARKAARRAKRRKSDSMLGSAVNMITGVPEQFEAAHRTASTQLNRFVYQIDDFFGAGVAVENENQSYARIRLDALQPLDDDAELKGTVKLRVVLPALRGAIPVAAELGRGRGGFAGGSGCSRGCRCG